MKLGCPSAQLPNLYSSTLLKVKSVASATSPVKTIGQEVTNKVPIPAGEQIISKSFPDLTQHTEKYVDFQIRYNPQALLCGNHLISGAMEMSYYCPHENCPQGLLTSQIHAQTKC